MPDDRAAQFNRRCAQAGWSIWLVATLIYSVIIATSAPGSRSVAGVFHTAADAWWHSRSPYDPSDLNGFLYFPQAAIVFSPFHFLGVTAGDIAWLWFRSAILATAMMRFTRVLCPPILHGRVFFLASALAMFAVAGNLRNAQFNITLTGLLLHAAATLAGQAPRRWISAAILLTVSVAVKPLAIVHLLLNAGLRTRLWLPLLGSIIVIGAIPLIHPSPAFAWHQYSVAIDTMRHAALPELGRFNDLRATLDHFHLELSPTYLNGLRAAMALCVYAVVLFARPRLSAPSHAWLVVTLGSTYIMLFNPRTEGLTYTLLVAPLALAGAALIHLRPLRSAGGWLGWALCALALVLGLAHVIVGPNSWLRPTATIPLLLYLLIAPLTSGGRRTLETAAP